MVFDLNAAEGVGNESKTCDKMTFLITSVFKTFIDTRS